jgi:hypothetical protein
MNTSIRDEWGQLNPENERILKDYIKGVQEKNVNHYIISISRDGENPPRSIISYDNAIDAVRVYDSYLDWGFAKNYLKVTLYEPSGRVSEKIIKRPPGIDPVFMRSVYIEVSDVLKNIKNHLDIRIYEELALQICRIFSKDNQRFDSERFFKNLGVLENTGLSSK